MNLKSDVAILLRLLPWLSVNSHATVTEVAQRFEIPRRKVLTLLESVRWTGRGQGYGDYVDIEVDDGEYISVRDTQGLDRPIQLTAREASALLAGLAYLAEVPVQGDVGEITALMAKLSDVLPQGAPAIAVVTGDQERATIDLLREAITQGRQVRITYASAGAQHGQERVIEPVTLSSADDRTHVRAWCHEAEAMRSFRIDRIVSLEMLADAAAEHIAEAAVADDRSGWIPVDMTVGIDFLGDFDRETMTVVTDVGHARRLTGSVATLEWLATVVLAAGGAIVVHEPAAVYELIRAKAAVWGQAHA